MYSAKNPVILWSYESATCVIVVYLLTYTLIAGLVFSHILIDYDLIEIPFYNPLQHGKKLLILDYSETAKSIT